MDAPRRRRGEPGAAHVLHQRLRALTVAGAALAVSSAARAQYQPYYPPPPPPPLQSAPPPVAPPPPPPEPPHEIEEHGVGAQLDIGASLLTKLPDLSLFTPGGVEMSQFQGGAVGRTGSMYMVSLGLSAIYRTGSVITIPLIGAEVGIPVATGYQGTVDIGTPEQPLTWVKNDDSTYYDGLDILGLGAELRKDDVRFGIAVKPGFRYVRMSGTLTQNLLTVDADAHKYSFSLRGDAEACYRFSHSVWGCVLVAPHLYEFGAWLNGGIAGIRIETN